MKWMLALQPRTPRGWVIYAAIYCLIFHQYATLGVAWATWLSAFGLIVSLIAANQPPVSLLKDPS